MFPITYTPTFHHRCFRPYPGGSGQSEVTAKAWHGLAPRERECIDDYGWLPLGLTNLVWLLRVKWPPRGRIKE
jgi:hypothetical protein